MALTLEKSTVEESELPPERLAHSIAKATNIFGYGPTTIATRV
jgi:hypothetical protein